MNHFIATHCLTDNWDPLDFGLFLPDAGFELLNPKPHIDTKVGDLYPDPETSLVLTSQIDLDITTLPDYFHQCVLKFQDKNCFIRHSDLVPFKYPNKESVPFFEFPSPSQMDFNVDDPDDNDLNYSNFNLPSIKSVNANFCNLSLAQVPLNSTATGVATLQGHL